LVEQVLSEPAVYAVEEYSVQEEPYYLPIADEVELFETAYAQRIPVLLKGPTGAGKTRFVEYMAYRLGRPMMKVSSQTGEEAEHRMPLITVACHEDLTASDLVGRYLLDIDGTKWVDGPLTRAVKVGAICYLDEVVEARKDTTVLIHPLTDYRRLLPIEKLGQVVEASDGFLLVISYNPGYQSALKDLKHSTRQRFIAIEFDYPPRDQEAEIIVHESGCSPTSAMDLARLGEKVRNLKEHGLGEGVSTRLLVYAGKLIANGVAPRRACQVAITWSLTDDAEVQRSIEEVVTSIFE
jgi:nitric oxide reductase NorQ protein